MVEVIEALVRRVAVSKSSTVTNAVEPSAQEREKAAAAARCAAKSTSPGVNPWLSAAS